MKRRPPTLDADPDWTTALAGATPSPGEDAETRLWRRAMAGVAPLRPAPKRATGKTPAPARAAAAAPKAAPDPAAGRAPPAPRVPAPRDLAPRDLAPGAVADLDRRNARRLKRGDYALDGKLDLHGMTEAVAHRAVSAFVSGAAARGKRCLLIVTGKGDVLRRALPRWLNESALRALIVALAPAHRRHGGDGAVYVLLKRRRDGRAAKG